MNGPAFLLSRRAGLGVLCGALGAALAGRAAAADVMLAVLVDGSLPGFRQDNVAPYVAARMTEAAVSGWRFAPGATPGSDRVEWRVTLDPYAGGGVRRYFPIPQVERAFGNRHRISVEARLYLDGQYQTLVLGQATILGGAQDNELADFIRGMTSDLLGEHGAYRSIDMGPHPRSGDMAPHSP
jgi:hypothetical protein